MTWWTSLALAGFIGSALVRGQSSTAQINGIVRDSSGLGIPGAEVKATQTATDAVRSVNTGPDGSYVLTNLPIGPYRLEVSKEGFQTIRADGEVGQHVRAIGPG